jgi:3-hydroxyisobutyrate dehydrogenase
VSDRAPPVGFVGLGHMGTPMSRRLVESGHAVIGYDMADEARQRLVTFGGVAAHDLTEVAEAVDVLILMLPNSEIVAEVLSNPTLVDHMRPGTLVIDMSSSEPLRTQALAGGLEKRGFKMIDAPVSGGVAGAEAGKLTVMVGGEAADLADARPYLEQFGRVVHAGPIGSGHAVKALNNLLSATHLWITGEAIVAGERLGIDPEVMLSIFNISSGRSGSTENKWPNFVLPGTFNSGFGLRLMVKDLGIAIQLAAQVGAPSVLGARALELWRRAAADLPADADHTEIARWLEMEAGTDVE